MCDIVSVLFLFGKEQPQGRELRTSGGDLGKTRRHVPTASARAQRLRAQTQGSDCWGSSPTCASQ